MVAIYGGINPKGLVLRETFSVKESLRPTTTPNPKLLDATNYTESYFPIPTPTVIVTEEISNSTEVVIMVTDEDGEISET
ncbi:unnamed protein product [Allacma fusca]|uniref:Uncharacterized protein n=1 Tax=Allacma fusca TaxID=39272 RepID=A0A8J2LQM8_9HEXA|nr:unnamed protein product [Allacma fusca]